MRLRKDTNLAEGEVTGHVHRAIGEGVKVFNKDGDVRLLDAPNGCTITHEEHKSYSLPAKRYDTFRAFEQDHAGGRDVE